MSDDNNVNDNGSLDDKKEKDNISVEFRVAFGIVIIPSLLLLIYSFSLMNYSSPISVGLLLADIIGRIFLWLIGLAIGSGIIEEIIKSSTYLLGLVRWWSSNTPLERSAIRVEKRLAIRKKRYENQTAKQGEVDRRRTTKQKEEERLITAKQISDRSAQQRLAQAKTDEELWRITRDFDEATGFNLSSEIKTDELDAQLAELIGLDGMKELDQ